MCSSLRRRVARGGMGRRKRIELNAVRSRTERRMRWNSTGPATAKTPSKNQGARKFILTIAPGRGGG